MASVIGPPGRFVLSVASRAFSVGTRLNFGLEALSQSRSGQYDFALGKTSRHLTVLNDDIRNSALAGSAGYLDAASVTATRRYIQERDLANYLPDDILTKVDRASMAHSLEVRSPFLDHTFVELTATIPSSLHRRGNIGKRLLGRLAASQVPDSIVKRPKKGFGAPLTHWLAPSLSAALQEALSDTTSATWDYFDADAVRSLSTLSSEHSRNLTSTMWRLLVFHHWKSQLRTKPS